MGMKAQKVKDSWERLRKDCDLLKGVGWSVQITKYDPKTARKLYRFREYLKKFIMTSCNLCDKDICTICNAVGSTKLTSDIDISINTEIHFSISVKRLLVLRNALREIFEDDPFFHNRNGKYTLLLVNDFFDINFYLSNYELTKDPTKDIGDFRRYFISDCYNNKCKNIVNQYYFATIEVRKPKIRKLDALYMKLSNDLDILLHANHTYSNDDNSVINLTSALSLYEDGSYHTQGSYFHIVMMLQKKIVFNIRTVQDKQIYNNLLSASIIENLCYSYIYKKKRDKYLSRVKDGLDRLKKYNIQNKLFNRLEKGVPNIKIEIQRILHKLSIVI
jgi:hypothetical protein